MKNQAKSIILNKYFISGSVLCLVILISFLATSRLNQPSTDMGLEQGASQSEYDYSAEEPGQGTENQTSQPTLAELRAAGNAWIMGEPISDYARFRSLDKMIDDAPFVVVGHFTELIESINGDRDPNNPLLESPYSYSNARLYNFQVTNVLKRDISKDNITVGLHYFRELSGEIDNAVYDSESGELIHEATEIDPYTIRWMNSYFLEPQLNQTVILFLRYSARSDRYPAAFASHTIAVRQDGSLTLRCPQVNNEYLTPEDPMHVFHSENGHEIHYFSRSNVIDDFLEGMTVEGLLTEMDINDVGVHNKIMTAAAASPAPVFPQAVTLSGGGAPCQCSSTARHAGTNGYGQCRHSSRRLRLRRMGIRSRYCLRRCFRV
jgi:hypothetical protein